MSSRHILVLDAGSSGPRCIVFDDDARAVGCRSGEWSYFNEDDVPVLSRAFDPSALWRDVCRLISDTLAAARISPGQVAAVAVTSQRQATVFLDKDSREVYAGPNTDLRAVFEGGAIDEDMREAVYNTTGHLPSLLLAPAKLRWFQTHRPNAYDRIASAVSLADWAVWRLTGFLVAEPTLAAELGLLDIRSREWCTALLDEMGLRGNTIPLVEAGTVVGKVTAAASKETGLAQGTPIAVAGADTQCGLLGMGVAERHQVGVVAGWSAPLQMVTPEPVLSPEARTWAGCFLDDQSVLESSCGDVGASYRWLGRALFTGPDDRFDEMDKIAGAAPLGCEEAIAFLGPSRMDVANVGMQMGGLMFPVPLTFSDLDRAHLVRASLEAAAYAIRANLEQIEDLAGVPAETVTVGGGMTRTTTFARIVADVVGRETTLSLYPNVSAVGAYLCARTALGDFASIQEASASVRSRLQAIEPDPLAAAEYEDLYQQWVELSGKLRELGL